MKKNETKHTQIIAFQHTLRPASPKEKGPKEYRDYRDTLIEMDRILDSGIEHDFILRKMGDYLGSSSRKVQRAYNRIWTALRFTILIALTGDSSRELAIRVSDSRLLKWFTSFDIKAKGTSKSAIDRHEKLFTAEEITALIHILNQAVGNAEQARRLILESELDFSRHWVDSTCQSRYPLPG